MKRNLWRTTAGMLAAGLLLNSTAAGASAEGGPVGIGEAFAATRCEARQATQQAQMLDAWHLDRLHMEDVWQLATGEGVTVAVIDTGVSTAGSLYFGNRVEAYDFVGISEDERNKQAKVDCLHGTFVTSLLAAGRRDDGGAVHSLTNFAGIAPGVKVLAYRALANSTVEAKQGEQPPPPASLIPVVHSIDAAIEAEVDIINLSLVVQSDAPDFDDFENAVYRAQERGIIIVAAAGNTTDNIGALFPASFPGVITVGMSTDAEAAHPMSYAWSPVTVGAPGAQVVGLAPSMPDREATTANQAFHQDTGTSFAAPIVSGVIALMLEYDAKLGRERATPEQIIARLKATADPPPATAPDPQLGWGIVNPMRALMDTRPAPMASEAAEFTPPPAPPPEPEPVDARMPALGLGVAVGSVLVVGIGLVAAIAIPAATRRPGP